MSLTISCAEKPFRWTFGWIDPLECERCVGVDMDVVFAEGVHEGSEFGRAYGFERHKCRSKLSSCVNTDGWCATTFARLTGCSVKHSPFTAVAMNQGNLLSSPSFYSMFGA